MAFRAVASENSVSWAVNLLLFRLDQIATFITEPRPDHAYERVNAVARSGNADKYYNNSPAVHILTFV